MVLHLRRVLPINRLRLHFKNFIQTIYMSHGQNQLFMLRMLSIVIVFGGDLIGFQLFVQPDAFGIAFTLWLHEAELPTR